MSDFATAATDSPYHVEFGRYAAPADESFSLFAPQHYEPNYRYPLLIWLHCAGGDERQLLRVMPYISLRNYVATAPRGTAPTNRRGGHGFTWRQDDQHFAIAEQRIWSAIQAAKSRYHVHPDRIFVAGFQSGGTMAYRFACEYPSEIAGVLSIGGAFPAGVGSLRRLNDVRRLNVFAAYAKESLVYPNEAVNDDLRLFHSVGVRLHLRQYPGGDDLGTEMLADVDRWIMEAVAGVTCESC